MIEYAGRAAAQRRGVVLWVALLMIVSTPHAVAAGAGSRTLADALLRGAATVEPADERDRLDPDRPHFPEAATTVGTGRAVLEGGYTATSTGGALLSQTYPEALLRVGVIAEWLEARIGQSVLDEQRTVRGVATHTRGAQDLYLGAKLALTAQAGWLPTIAVIPQLTVPTGDTGASAGRALPGVNLDASWEVVRKLFSVELLIANNRVKDALAGSRHELATGLTGALQVTDTLELFGEWDAFYQSGGIGSAGSRHYAVTGLVYFVTPDVALDARVGAGLNNRAADVLGGVGFAVRY